LQERVVALLRHELDGSARTPPELSSAALAELDVVHHRPERDVRERKAVAGLDVRLRPGLDLVANLETDGRDNVALLPVRVLEERDARRAVRVVLDRHDARRNAVLVPPEVDDAIEALVPAAAVTDRHAAEVVPAAGLPQRTGERRLRLLLGDLGEVEAAAETATGRRRPVGNGRHPRLPRRSRSGCPRRASRTPSSSPDDVPDGGRHAGP